MVDLIFFIVVRQFFPEGYEWILVAISYNTQVSLEVARSIFVIVGFIVMLICVPLVLYFVYNALKVRARMEH